MDNQDVVRPGTVEEDRLDPGVEGDVGHEVGMEYREIIRNDKLGGQWNKCDKCDGPSLVT